MVGFVRDYAEEGQPESTDTIRCIRTTASTSMTPKLYLLRNWPFYPPQIDSIFGHWSPDCALHMARDRCFFRFWVRIFG